MHAVVPATDELPEGVVFILKNINNSVNIDNQNRIHPFYMVYIGIDGEVICDYLNPKKMLDDIGFFVVVRRNRLRNYASDSMKKQMMAKI